jgi:DNA excision repair protein ERCC-2
MQPVHAEVPSPFPRRNRQVLLIPTVDTSYRHRDRHIADIARIVETVVAARPGRYMAFFSSFAYLAKVRQALRLPHAQVLMQLPGMPRALREQTLARLRESPGPMLLMAVTGGVFAEGIDLPGEQLIGAIVVGPSLPPVGFERALMREYHDRRDTDGFAYAMLYPGMQRVIQSAGRVIRSMDDRGVIALVGRRFASPEYARLLPPDWHEGGVGRLICPDPRARLAHFWSDVDDI